MALTTDGRRVRRALAGPSRALPTLTPYHPHRSGAGVHQPGFHGVGGGTGRAAHDQRCSPERLHRELQPYVPRQVSERAMVRDAGAGSRRDGQTAAQLQQGTTSPLTAPAPVGTYERAICKQQLAPP